MRGLARTTVVMLALMTLLTGVVYPLVVTAAAWVLFPAQAAGSMLSRNGQVVGSELIGQPFRDPKNLWGRLSATSPTAYNSASSSGSNLGPLNPVLANAVRSRIADLRAQDPGNVAPVPVDLVTASGSGLDPDISPAAADYQMERVARLRGLDEKRVEMIVQQCTRGRQLGFLGEPRVNVLCVNRALAESN